MMTKSSSMRPTVSSLVLNSSMAPFWEAQAGDHFLVPIFTCPSNLELFKRRLQMSKNISVDFDEVLPFYRLSFNDGPSNDYADLTDSNTSFALPSKSSAEKLVHAYFTTWHVLFP